MSQDHLELFFSSIRAHGRWSNNPSAQNFKNAYKKLLLRHEVKDNAGNVTRQDDTSILFVTKNKVSSSDANNEIDIADIAFRRKYGLIEDNLNEPDPEITLPKLELFLGNIITYIGGYCVKMVKKIIKCHECLSALMETDFTEDNDYDLISRKNRGGLIIPFRGVIEVCKKTENLIKRGFSENNGGFPNPVIYVHCAKTSVIDALGRKNIFPSLQQHHFDTTLDVEDHVLRLIKEICGSYLKIRLHHEAAKKNEQLHKSLIRKKLSRLVIFSNQ
jgi:hypothetical protein